MPSKEVKLVGLQKDDCRDLGQSVYEMHLLLSTYPPPEWNRFFEEAWIETFHETSRHIRVVDKKILLKCTAEELEGKYLSILKKAIQAANQSYEDFLEAKAEDEG